MKLLLHCRVGGVVILSSLATSSSAVVDGNRPPPSSINDRCKPRHVHLSVGRQTVPNNKKKPTSSMTVSFSFLPECALQYKHAAMGAVRLGEVGKPMSKLYTGGHFDDSDATSSYNASLTDQQLKHLAKARHGDENDGGGNGEVRYFSDVYYHIEMNDLLPGTRYQYNCLLLQTDNTLPPSYSSQQHSGVGQAIEWTNPKILSQATTTTPTTTAQMNDDNDNSDSNYYSTFLTPPSPGHWYPPPLERTIKFAVLGDLAVRPHSRETVRNLQLNTPHHEVVDDEDGSSSSSSSSSSSKNEEEELLLQHEFHKHHSKGIDCILLAGDLAYADGDHTVWDDWLDMMSQHSFFASLPVQVALGNHDLDHHYIDLEVGQAYETRFRMPHVKSAARTLANNDLYHPGKKEDYLQAKHFQPYEWGNAYYSFTFGPSKHIVMSSYSSFLPGSTQYKWLISELESTDRSISPWLIVMIHCPMYNTFHDHSNEIFMTEARKYLEPVFVEYTVNFVLSGHLHSYMRTVPTINGKPDPRGPIHIIQGNGGRQANEPYHNATAAEEYVYIRDHSMYGYGTLELANRTHAQWKWVQTGFNLPNETGLNGRFEPDFSLHDEVWVVNQLFVEDYDGQLENERDERSS